MPVRHYAFPFPGTKPQSNSELLWHCLRVMIGYKKRAIYLTNEKQKYRDLIAGVFPALGTDFVVGSFGLHIVKNCSMM